MTTSDIEHRGVQPSWASRIICGNLGLRPRQFEYDPKVEGRMVFGALSGDIVVCHHGSNEVSCHFSRGLAKNREDAILGLCWLRRYPDRFVAGSSQGLISMCDLNSAKKRPQEATRDTAESKGVAQAPTSGPSSIFRGMFEGSGAGGLRKETASAAAGSEVLPRGVVARFPAFDKLTSIHVDATDTAMIASGYDLDVKLYDLETATVVRDYKEIHDDHINISRFSNHSPFVFATSSFDRTVKVWDTRIPFTNPTPSPGSSPSASSPPLPPLSRPPRPLYTLTSDKGHVMLCFSPDDTRLLTSAVDNEVRQYSALDGKPLLRFDIPALSHPDNYTRAYYSSSGRFVLSGSSEEPLIRLHCAHTGEHLQSAELYPGRRHGSIYIQSLRGDPHCETKFSVLVNYRDSAFPLEIVHMDMLQQGGSPSSSSSSSFLPDKTSHSAAAASPPHTHCGPGSNDMSEASEDDGVGGGGGSSGDEAMLENKSAELDSILCQSPSTSPSSPSKTVPHTPALPPTVHNPREGGKDSVAWFVVGRPTRALLGGLQTALQSGACTDCVLVPSTARGRRCSSFESKEEEEKLERGEGLAENGGGREGVGQGVAAHAAFVAARSPTLKTALLAASSPAAAVPPSPTPNSLTPRFAAGSHEEESRGRDEHAAPTEPPPRLNPLQVAVPGVSSVAMLQVVLEYMYLDRLTLVCDRVARESRRSAAQTSSSKNKATKEEEGEKGASWQLPWLEEETTEEQGGSSEKKSPETATSANLTLFVECADTGAVLSECAQVLEVARALRCPHLASLVFARMKKLIDPSHVAAIAQIARRHASPSPRRPRAGNRPQQTLSSCGGCAGSECNGGGGGGGRECAVGVNRHCDDVCDETYGEEGFVAAQGLVSCCVHFLVSHLDVALLRGATCSTGPFSFGCLAGGEERSDANPSSSTSSSGGGASTTIESRGSAGRSSGLTSRRRYHDHPLSEGGWLRLLVESARRQSLLALPTAAELEEGAKRRASAALNREKGQGREQDSVVDGEGGSVEVDCSGEDEVDGASGVIQSRLVPTTTGHTCTAVLINRNNNGGGQSSSGGGESGLGGGMLVLGGGNRQQLHSFSQVLLYAPHRTKPSDFVETLVGTKRSDEGAKSVCGGGVWRRLSTAGRAPPSTIYHTTTPLEPPPPPPVKYASSSDGSCSSSSSSNDDSSSKRQRRKRQSSLCWPRHVLVFGGTQHGASHSQQEASAAARQLRRRRRQEESGSLSKPLFGSVPCRVLDCATLRWCEGPDPTVLDTRSSREHGRGGDAHAGGGGGGEQDDEFGRGPSLRTRHTMVAHYPAHAPTSLTAASSASPTAAASPATLFPASTMAADVRPALPKRSIVSTLLLFGGYSPDLREAFNDVWLLEVVQTTSTSTADTEDEEEEEEEEEEDDGTAHDHFKEKKHGKRGQEKGGCLSRGDYEHGDLKDVNGEFEHPFELTWRKGHARGTAPPPRLAHSSIMVQFGGPLGRSNGDSGGGGCQVPSPVSPASCMVVFGGVGLDAVFNDVHLLSCQALDEVGDQGGSGLCWESAVLEGSAPEPRYGHSMKLLPGSVQAKSPSSSCSFSSSSFSPRCEMVAELALFGGTKGTEVFGDLFLLSLTVDSAGARPSRLRWSQPRATSPNLASVPLQLGQSPTPSTPPTSAAGPSPPPMSPQEEGEEQSEDPPPLVSPEEADALCASLPPFPRSRHDMCEDVCGGRLLLFGGSDESRDRTQQDRAHRTNRDMDNAVFELTVCRGGGDEEEEHGGGDGNETSSSSSSSGGGVDGSSGDGSRSSSITTTTTTNDSGDSDDDDGSDAAETKRRALARLRARRYRWASSRSFVLEAGREPCIEWAPSSLLRDLASLVGSPLFADVAFMFDEDDDDSGGRGSVELSAAPAREYGADDEEEGVEGEAEDGRNCHSAMDDDDDDDETAAVAAVENPALSVLRAHRLVLGLRRGPLAAMLSGGMKEAVSGCVDLRGGGVRREAFACVLAFLYTDSLLFPLDTATARTSSSSSDFSSSDGSAGRRQKREEANGKKKKRKKKEFAEREWRCEGGPAAAAVSGLVVEDEVVAEPSPELVMEVCFLANQYALTRLVDLCEGLLFRLAHRGGPSQNAAALYSFADLLGLDNLKDAVKSVVFRSAGAWREFKTSLGTLSERPLPAEKEGSGALKPNDAVDNDAECSEVGVGGGGGSGGSRDDEPSCCLSASLVAELERERTTLKHLYCGFHDDHVLQASLFAPLKSSSSGEGGARHSSPPQLRWSSVPGSELVRRVLGRRAPTTRGGIDAGEGGGAEEGSGSGTDVDDGPSEVAEGSEEESGSEYESDDALSTLG